MFSTTDTSLHLMKAFTILLVFIATLGINAQQMLQYNVALHDTFNIKQQAKQHIVQDLDGVDQVIENILEGKMLFKVVEIKQDLITFEMKFKHLMMRTISPTLGELFSGDTATQDNTDLTSTLFKGILNIPVTIVMEKTGKIRSVTGGENIVKSMLETANLDDEASIAAMKSQLEKQFGSEALSMSFEQMTYFLPTVTVKSGDTWTNEFTGNLQAKNNWTLTAHTNDGYTISGKADVTMTAIDDVVVMALTGNQNTLINFDTKTGFFKDITVEGVTTGTTQINADNLTFPTKITSTITYNILN